MCGIAGIFNRNDSPVSSNLIKSMCSVLKHRGPDEQGQYISGQIGLGHTRLSIIDLSSGQQPMTNEDGTIWIVFNGEIYNFPSLKEYLEKKGHVFKTHSDTEVIIHLYEETGEEFTSHLRGMFAIALWDNNKQQLILARDRIGIKPLYYSLANNKIIFGSEIKAILQDSTIPRKIDKMALDDYFTFSYIPSPKSIFESIRKLPPATLLVCSKHNNYLKPFWDISYSKIEQYCIKDWKEVLFDKWNDTINCHLISDVPLGAFLSGGLDSSSVVAAIAKQSNERVNTFSIGFKEKSFDESDDALSVAQYFDTNHNMLQVTPSATKILKELIWHYDEPFADTSSMCLLYLSEMARKHVKVVLSGDGGDENFAGYDRYYIDMLENRIRQSLPSSIRKPFFSLAGLLYPKLDFLPRILRLKTFFQNVSYDHCDAYATSMSILRAKEKDKIYNESFKASLKGYSPFDNVRNIYNQADTDDPLSKIIYVDVHTYLPDDYLVKVDRASMAKALEVRPPFLDHEFMELTATIPSHLKIKGKKEKYIWNETIKDYLPKKILDKKKKGFDVPVGDWFRNELRNLFEDQVLSTNSSCAEYFNIQELNRLFMMHCSKVRDYSHILWELFVFELWHRMFIRNETLDIFQ